MEIKVIDICGENCVTFEDGSKVAQLLMKNSDNEKILDFTGVNIFSSPFFNALIGPFFKTLGENGFDENVRAENISESGKATLDRVIKNLKENLADPERKNAQIDVINRRIEDSNGS